MKNSLRKLIQIMYTLEPFYGEEKEWRKAFWTTFSSKLSKKERKFLDKSPEFVRECIVDNMEIPGEDAVAMAKEYLLAKARW